MRCSSQGNSGCLNTAKLLLGNKERLASGELIPTNANNEGAARLKVKTVDEMMQDREAANKNAGESDKGKDREKVH